MLRHDHAVGVDDALRKKILVIRSANIHETARALQHVRTRVPEAEISLLLSNRLMEHFSGNPLIDRLVVYDPQSGGKNWKRVVALLARLRKECFDEVVILSPGRTGITTLYDIILFSLFIPARRRIILDDGMHESELSLHHHLKVVCRNLLWLFGVALGAFVTRFVLACSPESKSGHGPQRRRVGSARRVAMLIPIVPDISHTFVYREVLALKRHGADFVAIGLEKGDYAVLHSEAEELLGFTTFVSKVSQTRYLMYYVWFSLRHPRRVAELIRLYQPYAGGDPLLFLRLDQYHNALHPMHGVVLAWMLERLGTTSIHAYGSTYPTTRAMTAARLLDIPFSTTAFVDFDFDYDFKMLQEKLRRSTFFVSHTDFCRNRLEAVNPEPNSKKIHTIRIGVDPDRWQACRPGDNSHTPTLLAICRFVEKKGLDVLVRACALLKERHVAFQCLLIGDGPKMSRLRSLVSELDLSGEVQFTGALSTDQVRSYLQPSNILVVPSVYAKDGERDGIPTVLVEALACGVPAVATAISGIPELIEHDVTGLLVPERDEERLASAIHALLVDPELRARLRRNGRQRVLREFDVRVNALRLWSIILRAHYPDSAKDHHHHSTDSTEDGLRPPPRVLQGGSAA
ncbi:MAG: glycosyltransferase [Candidatus Methylomirabilis oxyfera]|nr:glycosyltransferase [Candidatus Methylomirabilis oxyfera]